MPDYMKMYFQLAARVADAIDLLQEALEQGGNVKLHRVLEMPRTNQVAIRHCLIFI